MSTRFRRGAQPMGEGQAPQQGARPTIKCCRVLRVTSPYMQGPDVYDVQAALQDQGYHAGLVNGVYDGATREAVKYFENDKGIDAPNGVVTAEIYQALGIPCAEVLDPNPCVLVYNNPFAQATEVAWYNGRTVVSIDLGKVEVAPEQIRWAREYVPVYGVTDGKPDFVPEQLYIYDSVPGEPDYSPIWRFYWVVVPRSYVPNTLRSEGDVLLSVYPVIETDILYN